ncbi:hypothetical protein [Bradyrhizobium centrolobii]|uniref:hypothetical protein n=1 Tax=Bradyrhizobium centrolobii TaxID=1505087 RepID=UPI0007C5305E|nr:hypothetical protein [Bradyrhizobium centrolobii]
MKINKCTRAAFERRVVRSFRIWCLRSKKKWKIDWGQFKPLIIEAKVVRDPHRRRREAAAERRAGQATSTNERFVPWDAPVKLQSEETANARMNNMFETWDVNKRIAEAKRLTEWLVEHAHYLLYLRENNAIVVYSDALSKQIPRSYAANAFNAFREAMHQIEMVRLIAFWGPAPR